MCNLDSKDLHLIEQVLLFTKGALIGEQETRLVNECDILLKKVRALNDS